MEKKQPQIPEEIADKVIEQVVREYQEERRTKRLLAVTPVTQTAKACLMQFSAKGKFNAA